LQHKVKVKVSSENADKVSIGILHKVFTFELSALSVGEEFETKKHQAFG